MDKDNMSTMATLLIAEPLKNNMDLRAKVHRQSPHVTTETNSKGGWSRDLFSSSGGGIVFLDNHHYDGHSFSKPNKEYP
ncbi:hypothetical protein CEXT_450881 [Caerostris extrusa]|uniref:Uncharacterized protein n=1 Tax=Caerostris extrusa TaxID=172846 RepID=A0AAV4QGA9_CAEEX|nr:hypothetical protein CEXT_450881 [Caerostris extrusa]